MTDDDVDPENPRPKGHYPRFVDNEWHYVPDDPRTDDLARAGRRRRGRARLVTSPNESRGCCLNATK